MLRYQQKREKEVLDEIFFRYNLSSKKLAGALLRIYKDVTLAEYEDLVQIGLTALWTAVEDYQFAGSFFSYWETIAKNEMLEHIQNFTLSYTNVYLGRDEAEVNNFYDSVLASSVDEREESSSSIMVRRIERILENPSKYDINEEDAFMFELYYISGIDYSDIARMSNAKYFTVRSKIHRAREKIAFILFNSKE